MRWPVIFLLLTGIVAAFAASVLVVVLGLGQGAASRQAPVETTILVAKHDLPASVSISPDALTTKSVPANDLPPGYFTDATRLVGKILTVPVSADQAITRRLLAHEGAGLEVVAKLPRGLRAMTVPLPDYAAIQDLIYPGSIVDVIATFQLRRTGGDSRAVSTELLQNVEVLGIEEDTVGTDLAAKQQAEQEQSRNTSARPPRRARNRRVTLKVTTEQAKALQLAVEHGTISLVMRNPMDRDETDSEPTLLNEGRLAKFADYLEAQVRESGPDEPEPSVANRDPEPEPLFGGGDSGSFDGEHEDPKWNVQVVRGTKVEQQSFPVPADVQGQADDRN